MLKKLLLSINDHDRALIMVGIGVAITLFQMLGLYLIFEKEYINSRAIINTMNISAPLLLLGFDITSPQIAKNEKNSSFIWNFVLTHFLLMLFFLFLILLVNNEKTIFLLLGLSLGAIFSSNLLLNEYERNYGAVKNYFFNLHVRDRFNRTLGILIIAFFAQSVFLWSILFILFSVLYLFFFINKYRSEFEYNFNNLKKHIFLSFPYLLTAVIIVFVYRIVFYLSFFFDSSSYAAKIDFWLMLTLFLQLPLMNVSKFAETKAKGDIQEYIFQMKNGWNNISRQQSLILFLVFLSTFIALHINKVIQPDIIEIILPITLSMMLITLHPSFFYLALLEKRIALSVKHMFVIALISIIIFSIKIFYITIPVAYLLFVNCLIYLIYNLIASHKILNIKILDILRLRAGLIFSIIIFSYNIVLFKIAGL